MPKPDRASSFDERCALKAVTGMALRQAGGEHAAPFTGKSVAQMYRYGQPTDPNFAPVDVALELDRLAEEPIITTQMAASQGFRLVPVETENAASDLMQHVSHFIGEASDVSTVVLDALADGELSPNERHDILKEIRDVQKVLTNLRRAVAGTEG